MNKIEEIPCPCCSQKAYATCCQPLHQGKDAPDALALMRSRFSAYALGLADYIITTTHPASLLYQDDRAEWIESILKFSRESTFHNLEILEFTPRAPFSSVTFAAHLSKKRKNTSFTEKSYFELLNGRWFYRNGLIASGLDEQLTGPSPEKLLPMAYFGDAVLKQKAEPVGEITEEIRQLVGAMQETMDALDGLGIAAPQVKKSLRIFLIRQPIENFDETITLGDLKVFINPTLFNPGEDTWADTEGCLSIPGIEADVERPYEVSVRYTDLNGEQKEERASGWYAKALMHEMDHLDGILFTDRLPAPHQKKIEPLLQAMEARIRKGRAS
ncbi:peptide deformylase [Estrella lausannensis]|uniref:Peptide deformylase n=1 Tax=Estrella lausannensis TaxID=483423 RepID=A0A0H5DN73_9BACT|nr:peptide deformylase [Estrella lausannensis]CRX37557.1 Polypeptide deformylase [Estrella lausannensis]